MLLSLSQWLQAYSPEFGFMRVFQYITFRAVMAAMTSLVIGLVFGPWVIRRLASLKIGCVGITQRFFPEGRLSAEGFDAAETAARVEIEPITGDFGPGHWREAYASSGTAAALAEILEKNGFSAGGVTPDGLARLRKRMIAARHVSRLSLQALKPDRAPVLAGGLAIMIAAVEELRIQRIDPVGGALRLGVLYDLLGRTIDADVRDVTVRRFVERYAIDPAHGARGVQRAGVPRLLQRPGRLSAFALRLRFRPRSQGNHQ